MSDDQNSSNNSSPESQEQMSKTAIIDKLSGECMEADWNMLKQHYQRGAVVVVSKELNLFEVGATIAKDEVDQLKAWMKDGHVHQASPQEAKKWEEDLYKKNFQFIIVQPYVLIQRI